MNQELPTDLELTSAQVADAIKNFRSFYLEAKQELRLYRSAESSLPSMARPLFLNAIEMGEEHLNMERSKMVTGAQRLYEDALAHLVAHECAVVPGAMEEVMEMIEEFDLIGDPPVPRALTNEKAEHYAAILDLTKEFLESVGSPLMPPATSSAPKEWLSTPQTRFEPVPEVTSSKLPLPRSYYLA